ncbi:MAG: hypothetical protein JXB50_10840, partial [Spirochaetes bacterium]|nr:hypothetical protein [Spirochaetota bacterium]
SLAEAVTQNLILEINNFTKYGRVETIERTKYTAIFNSLNVKPDDPLEYEMAYKIAQMINVDFALFGSLSKLGTSYTLNCRLIKVENGSIVFDDTSYFTSEEALPEIIEKVAKKTASSRVEVDVKDFKQLKYDKIAITYFTHNIEDEDANNFIIQIKSSLMSFKKFYSVDQTIILNSYTKFKKSIYDELTTEELTEIGKSNKAKYVLFGNIMMKSEGFYVYAKLLDPQTGEVAFDRVIFTREMENIVNIGQKIADMISSEKEFAKTDEVFDFDKYTYESTAERLTKIKRTFLITGSTVAGISGGLIVAAAVLTGIYIYRFNYMANFIRAGKNVSSEYYDINSTIGTIFIAFYAVGGVFFFGGLCIDIVALTTLNIKIKFYKNLRENLVIIKPVIDLYPGNINLGMAIKF